MDSKLKYLNQWAAKKCRCSEQQQSNPGGTVCLSCQARLSIENIKDLIDDLHYEFKEEVAT